MQIQINTDHHIDGSEARDAWARAVLESELTPYAGKLTRVEVHFTVENAGAGPSDMRCLIEARVTGRPPVAVTQHADTLADALNGAVHKLSRALEHAQGRADKHAHDMRTLPVDDTIEDDFVPSAEPF